MKLEEIENFQKEFAELLLKYKAKIVDRFSISYDFNDNTYLMYGCFEKITDDDDVYVNEQDLDGLKC